MKEKVKKVLVWIFEFVLFCGYFYVLFVNLVCGFGYGTTAVVKDALLNGYQVYIRECLPAYRVENYQNWDDIDIVLSTVPLELPVKKPFAQVHVIFEKEDYVKLDILG